MKRETVIGSRGFQPIAHVTEYVYLLPSGTVVVSGGAPGVDEAAEAAAGIRGLPEPDVIEAQWKTHGKLAGKLRNWPIVSDSNHVQAFWDGWSNGTAHAVTAAVALGIPVDVELAAAFKIPRRLEAVRNRYLAG